MKFISMKRIINVLDRDVEYYDVLNDRTDTLDRLKDIEDVDENLLLKRLIKLFNERNIQVDQGVENLAEEIIDLMKNTIGE